MGNFCQVPHIQLNSGSILCSKCEYKGISILILQGDICEEIVDAVVNPTNYLLNNNFGISRTIITKAGEEVRNELQEIVTKSSNPLKNACAFNTSPGDLYCNNIIHVIVPNGDNGDSYEENLLKKCVENSLALANQLRMTSISFPLLSTGLCGFPKENCIQIMVESTINYISDFKKNYSRDFLWIKFIRFINHDNQSARIFKDILNKVSCENKSEIKFVMDEEIIRNRVKSYDKVSLVSFNNIGKENPNVLEEI